MKPICDHPSYCKNSDESLYLGQDHHVSHTGQRNTGSYYPSGWDTIKDHWKGKCTYTRHGSSHGALCNNETSDHFWLKASANSRGFICGMIDDPLTFTADLGSKNGVAAHRYRFEEVDPMDWGSDNYDTIMVDECKKIGMKPICDHPSYCNNADESLYLGQDHH